MPQLGPEKPWRFFGHVTSASLFHSSAPKVESTFPDDGTSFPRKLKITQILRTESIATVSTNHPHNLFIGDAIQIVDSTQDIYNKTTKVLLVLFLYEESTIPTML